MAALADVPHPKQSQLLPQFGGYLNGEHVSHVIIDPGSTYSLLDQEFADAHDIPYVKGSSMSIRLANGAVEVPIGETHTDLLFEVAGVIASMRFPVVNARGTYSLLLGNNWLRRVGVTADYVRDEYCITTRQKHIYLKNTPLGCTVERQESISPKVSADDSAIQEFSRSVLEFLRQKSKKSDVTEHREYVDDSDTDEEDHDEDNEMEEEEDDEGSEIRLMLDELPALVDADDDTESDDNDDGNGKNPI